jgi:RHS repeat-associated protein
MPLWVRDTCPKQAIEDGCRFPVTIGWRRARHRRLADPPGGGAPSLADGPPRFQFCGRGSPLGQAGWRIASTPLVRIAGLGMGVVVLCLLVDLLLGTPAYADVAPSGSYQTDVPIVVPAFHGLEPHLEITYDSESGNGPLGVGWRLSGLSEVRRSSPGKGTPRYDNKDVHYLDGMELIPCRPGMNSPSCKYPPTDIDGVPFKGEPFTTRSESYLRIAFDPISKGGRWYVWRKDGTRLTYVANPLDPPGQTLTWPLGSVKDTVGNTVQYQYVGSGGDQRFVAELYLEAIVYNGVKIKLVYESRPDIQAYATGQAHATGHGLIAQRQRVKTIDVTVGGERARAYALRYATRPTGPPRSLLTEVQQYGTDAFVDGSGVICRMSTPAADKCRPEDPPATSLPPVRLRYPDPPADGPWAGGAAPPSGMEPGTGPQAPSVYKGTVVPNPTGVGMDIVATGDVNGDGRTDWIGVGFDRTTKPSHLVVSTALADPVDPPTVQQRFSLSYDQEWLRQSSLPDPVRIYSSWTMDFNGDGRSDLMLALGYAYLKQDHDPDANPGHEAFERLALLPALSLGDGHYDLRPAIRTSLDQPLWLGYHGLQSCRPGDLDGDGKEDLACNSFRINDRLEPAENYLLTAISHGDGTFDLSEASLGFPTGEVWRPMAVADHNRDGRADLMLLDYRPEDLEKSRTTPTMLHYDVVTALSRGGDASTFDFRRQQTDWVRDNDNVGRPELTAADINGDGWPDYLAFVHGTNGRDPMRILSARTRPDGPLALHEQPVPDALSTVEKVITVGDADGDGREDLLVASRHEPGSGMGCSNQFPYPHAMLTRVLSAGDGTFTLPATWDDCQVSREVGLRWNLKLRPRELYGADTNGDGLADFLLAGNTEKTSVDLRDDISPSTGRDTHRWVPADITGDGRTDLLYIRNEAQQTHADSLLRQADGSFAHQSAHISPELFGYGRPVMRDWKVMDVNGDGRTDLVYVRSQRSSGPGTKTVIEVEALISTGDGDWELRRPQWFEWPGALPDSPQILPMDVNGDGRTDLVSLMNDVRSAPSGDDLHIQTLLAQDDGSSRSGFTFSAAPLRAPSVEVDSATLTWRPMDVNGDGRADLVQLARDAFLKVTTLLAQGDSDWVPAVFPLKREADDGWEDVAPPDTVSWRAMDINADGKADLVHLARSASGVRPHTLLSTGGGDWLSRWHDFPLNAADRELLGNTLQWLPGDVNGDSHTDLTHLHRSTTGLRVDSLLGAGDGQWHLLLPSTLTDPSSAGDRSSPSWRVGDADGDGNTDLMRVDLGAPLSSGTPRPFVVSALRSRQPQDRIVEVTGSLGGSTEITYAPASQYDPSLPARGCYLPLGAIRQVVASTTIRDGRGLAAETTNYSYNCPRWSHYHRAFLGWTHVNASRPQVTNQPGSITVLGYRQSDQCGTQLQDASHRDAEGFLVGSRDQLIYNSSGASPPYNCTLQSRKHLAYGPFAAVQNVESGYAYDEFGNVRDVFDHGSIDRSGDERTIGVTYKAAPGPWIVGLPWQQTLNGGVHPVGKLLRSTFFCYDGDNGTDSTNCSGIPTKGQLTAQQRVDDKGLYVRSTYQYDGFGNLAATQTPRKFGTAAFFDKTYHLYPEFITNALGHTTSLEWNTVLGQVKKITDANGSSTDFEYDKLGRLDRTTRPGSTTNPGTTTTKREYLDWGDPHQQRIREQVDDGTPDGLWTETYVDGLARVYKVVREGAKPFQPSVRITTYSDASSHPYKQSDWFTPPAETRRDETFNYDEVGRLTSQIHPDDTSQSFAYVTDDPNGITTSVWSENERKHEKKVYQDAHGRVVKISELDRTTGKFSTVNYTYSAADELLTMTDPNGNVTTNTWDLLGRLRTVDDPDLGLRSYTYDLNGNLKTQTDAKNKTITYTYDALDRPATKTYATGPPTIWTYDEPGHGASKGRLTSVTDRSAAGCPQDRSEELTYHPLGQMKSRTKCIDGRAYTIGFDYDQLGRQEQVTYPDNETISYTYDPAGRLKSMPGLVDQFRYDAAGRMEEATYANGPKASLTYDPKRKWLETSKVTRGTSTLYDAGYSYEPSGLVRSTTSTTNKMNLTFVHDELDRLKEVNGDFTQSFSYDPAGNMTFNSAAGITYIYPPQGPNGCPINGAPHFCRTPHAPQTVWPLQFHYDANGNLSSVENLQQHTSRGIDWTDDDQPELLTDFNGMETRYGYDAAGERISRRRGLEHNRYYSPHVEHSATFGLIKSYYAGSQLVARRQAGSTHWYHADHLGSIRLITDANGSVVKRYEYAPYGDTPGAAATGGSEVQFAGQRTDGDNGLVHMSARDYDPHTAQFISPDTIIPDPLNTQALNRYAYAYNSPTSYTDPTGHQPQPPIGISGSPGSGPSSGGPSISIHVSWPPSAARPAGQVCSACYGGGRISDTPFDTPQTPATAGTLALPQAPPARRVSEMDFSVAGWQSFWRGYTYYYNLLESEQQVYDTMYPIAVKQIGEQFTRESPGWESWDPVMGMNAAEYSAYLQLGPRPSNVFWQVIKAYGMGRLLAVLTPRPTVGPQAASKAVLSAGAARAEQYGANWSRASLSKAIERHAGPSATSWVNGEKIIFENPATGRQVIYDTGGNYFRIYQPRTIGSTKGVYLNLLGRTPAPARYLKGGSIKSVPLQGDPLEEATHFLADP